MFGHNDNQSDDQSGKSEDKKDSLGVMPAVVPDPSVTAGLNGSSPSPAPTIAPSAPSVPSTPSIVKPSSDAESSATNLDGHEEETEEGDGVLPVDNSTVADDASNDDQNNDASPDSPQPDSELMDLKQQALQQLSPLVGHLDQTPEEKFRTTMMMIQASDDSTLVKTAFEAAQAIGDEKARAQALLDVINEINYFTQHKSDS